ncbi:MAG: BtpA/SgcQ family protein [Candidatus Hodarchaeota archaeon]
MGKISCYGMVHIPPLIGAPQFGGSLKKVLEHCKTDVNAYLESGIDGIIFENFGDAPFYPGRNPPETIASMTWIIANCMVGHEGEVKVGVNVLRNDAISALAIGKAVGADFIRINIHQGTSVTDQGIISGKAHETMRYRRAIDAENIKIFADVNVKHANQLIDKPLAQEYMELVERGLVDGALILTGVMTGLEPDINVVKSIPHIKEDLPDIQVILGSGVDLYNIQRMLDMSDSKVDGFIIGTAFKEENDIHRNVDKNKVKEFMDFMKGLN